VGDRGRSETPDEVGVGSPGDADHLARAGAFRLRAPARERRARIFRSRPCGRGPRRVEGPRFRCRGIRTVRPASREPRPVRTWSYVVSLPPSGAGAVVKEDTDHQHSRIGVMGRHGPPAYPNLRRLPALRISRHIGHDCR
jgi:hypothetical protein